MLSSSYSTSGSSSDEELVECLEELQKSLLTMAKTMLDNSATSRPPPKKRRAIFKEREEAQERLERDYFAENPVYPTNTFRRRFRMSKGLFMRIVNDLQNATPYFTQRWYEQCKKGFSLLQKCASAIRQLSYGSVPDSLDEYLRMFERTSREVLQKFCKLVVKLYAKEYLRRPTVIDIEKLHEHHESTQGFPGMLGSSDCTHWAWRNCPVAWRGQYMRGDHEHATLIFEAVASQDLWIWHAYSGVASSNNDINVLHQSAIFDDVYSGNTHLRPFQVNGVQYRYGYYLADEIYSDWATFLKFFPYPQDSKRIKFKNA